MTLASTISAPRPLALTADQHQFVIQASNLVAPQWRCRFLNAVEDALLPLAVIDDASVQAATLAALQRMRM